MSGTKAAGWVSRECEGGQPDPCSIRRHRLAVPVACARAARPRRHAARPGTLRGFVRDTAGRLDCIGGRRDPLRVRRERRDGVGNGGGCPGPRGGACALGTRAHPQVTPARHAERDHRRSGLSSPRREGRRASRRRRCHGDAGAAIGAGAFRRRGVRRAGAERQSRARREGGGATHRRSHRVRRAGRRTANHKARGYKATCPSCSSAGSSWPLSQS